MREASSPEGSVVGNGYRPLIRFTTSHGETIEFRNSVNSSDWNDGDRVAVVYDPREPQNAAMDSFGDPGLGWTLAVFYVAAGMAAVAAWRRSPA